ncbi:unnamed protein product [Fusarium equiseti]|uniref:Uncharacterized protein n=1 Tax=Fusarium equiseti TaxID=61235 RepID=A0A8J2IRD3_FUSEQ|nr:unnamed protein product [Fusarium equiseti]
MWSQLSGFHLVASAVLLPACQAFSVTTTNDANALASTIFGNGITILSASFSGAAVSSGTFVDGPFGIGSGGILTSGAAVGALPNGDLYVNNGAPGSSTYCGANTFNAAILTVDLLVQVGFSGLRVEAILASEEEGGSADPIGIFIGSHPWISPPLVIRPPNSVTSYPGSTPPLWIDILAQGAQTMVIAICDQSDSEWDSGLLKPRPLGDGGYKFGQPKVPQGKPTGAGHSQEEGKPAEVAETEPKPKYGGDNAKPEPVKPYKNGGDKSVQPQTYHHEPTGAGDSYQENNSEIEPKPQPLGGDDQHEPVKPTFQRRPGPASTPAVSDAPIVVVSEATF